MSWNIKAIGTRENVKAAVQASSAPDDIKAHIVKICDAREGDPAKNSNDGLRVEGFGHYANTHDWSGIGKLEVEAFTLAKPAEAKAE